jgi:hypothetical protein
MCTRANVAHVLGARFTVVVEMNVLQEFRIEETAIKAARFEEHNFVRAEA